MTERGLFKRMVLGLPQSASDYAAVAAAAKLAELLGIGLAATFVEDATLLNIAGLSCVRELRPLGGGWRQISHDQLVREIEHAAETARRLFTEATQKCSVETSFSLARGAAAQVLCSEATAKDILVIVEPKNPGERVTQQFTELLTAAFRAVSAVMIVPCRVAQVSGPIIAIAASSNDPAISAAFELAAAASEALVVVPLKGFNPHSTMAERVASAGIRLKIAPALQRTPSASVVAAGITGLKGRVIVMQRGIVDDAVPLALASLCAIPVLIIEPDSSSTRD